MNDQSDGFRPPWPTRDDAPLWDTDAVDRSGRPARTQDAPPDSRAAAALIEALRTERAQLRVALEELQASVDSLRIDLHAQTALLQALLDRKLTSEPTLRIRTTGKPGPSRAP